MKHTLLFAALAASVCANAQLVTSTSFESWTGSTPDGWSGSKTTFSADSVQQADQLIQFGSYAVRLINNTGMHKRFTSQQLTVVDGQAYNISWYTRGAGDVRTGLFDGRTAGSGYATYNNWVTVNGPAWTQTTQQVVAANDTVGAEFIISVRATPGGIGIVEIDSVRIELATINPPVNSSIYDIQYTTLPSGDSPLLGQSVNTGGRVAAFSTSGYALQSGNGPWSGIWVSDNTNAVALGDSVTITANVSENFNQTQLGGVTNFVLVNGGNSLVENNITTADANAEDWEGVLVRVGSAICTNADVGTNFGQWVVNDGSADIWIDDLWYAYTPNQGTAYDVAGIAWYSFSERKIQPRDQDDVSVSWGIADASTFGVEVFPNPAADVLNVVLPNGNANYTMMDATGRAVLNGNMSSMRNALDVAMLAPGAYSLVLNTGSAIGTVRVMVQR